MTFINITSSKNIRKQHPKGTKPSLKSATKAKPKYKKLTSIETLARQIEKSGSFLKRVLRAGERLTVGNQNAARLRALLGVEGVTPLPLLSDVSLRIQAANILFDTTKRLLRTVAPKGTPMFHITFVDDIGLMSDRKPILKLAALKRKVDKAIRSLGLSGVVMVEVQALTNYPAKGEGRTLMVNAHGLCWGTVSRRKFRAAKQKLNGSRSWKNQFGAQPIFSRRLEGGRPDALRIISYLAKMPHDGKYRVPIAKDKFRFHPTLKGYPDSLALRIAEGLSHYSIYDAVFAVGDGKGIRKAWKSEVEAWHRDRLKDADQVHTFDVSAFWTELRSASIYRPYELE